MIPENVARLFDHLKGDQNRKSIFAYFLLHDESNLWPISGAFNVTKEAIRILKQRESDRGETAYGLELALELDQIISELVNEVV